MPSSLTPIFSLLAAMPSPAYVLSWMPDALAGSIPSLTEIHQRTTESSDARIRVTINPEARVSVTFVGPVPTPVSCGAAVALTVEVINQAFVTSRLQARMTGSIPARANLMLDPLPLKGAPIEFRALHIILTTPGTQDITISFRLQNESPDFGGNNRVHFLMRCLPYNVIQTKP